MSALEIKSQVAEVFVPLLEDSRYKGARGGRGSGKSHFFAGEIVEQSVEQPGLRTVCIREVQKTLRESAKRLIEDKIEEYGVGSLFDVQDTRIKTPGDGVIIFQGMQDHTAESIKSLEGFNRAWGEEAQTLSQRSLELLRPTIRAPESEIWFSWNPRNESDPVDKFLWNEKPDGSVVVHANYSDNPWFAQSVLEAERLLDKEHNPDRYAHIWLGDYEPTAIGAIWTRQVIAQGRRDEAPTMGRIVVSVDPAVSSEAGSDKHGITVEGLGEDQRGYLLDDVSMRGTPKEWATRAITTFDRYEADAIVIEKNQGGDMCRHTLESVRPGLPIIEVVATRGKHVRAEPIAALYEAGRISHVGTFPEIEDQMCKTTAAGYEGEGSPDGMDSVVWGFTELFPSMVKKAPAKKWAAPDTKWIV